MRRVCLYMVTVSIVLGGVAFGQCSYQLVDSSGNPEFVADVQYQGGLNGTVHVSTATGCSWAATSNTTWLSITSGSQGVGPGTVTFTAQQNQGGSRIGSLLVAGQTLTITQNALLGPSGVVTLFSLSKSPGFQGAFCTSSVPALSQTFQPTDAEAYSYFIIQGLNVGDSVTEQYYTPSGSLYTGAGGNFPLPTSSGGFFGFCDSTATGLKIFGAPPASNPGLWNVNIYINNVLSLSVPFTIAGNNTCSYSLSGNTNSFNGSGGSGSITVTASQGCFWSASTTFPWIQIASSGLSGTGSGTVNYTVAANTGGARSGTIVIAGQAFTITQAAAGGPVPSITQGGIAEPWTNSTGLAPGAWVSIYGTNLSSLTSSWSPTAGQPLPTSLDGVTVTIGGQPAVPSYVSPTQINVLVPAAVGTGPTQIVVNNNGNIGAGYSVQSTTYLPAIYARPAPGISPPRYYVTAVDPVTGQIVGNFSADPSAVHAPRAGETIDLYGLGLGPASQFPTSTAFTGDYPLSSSVTVTLGGTQLTPEFAALVGPGLYQVRITIPSTMALGDQPIQLTVGGAPSPANVFLSIGQ